jgi:hydrogenase nickel incorporation protein HypB
MANFKTLELHIDVNAANDEIADGIRRDLRKKGTFLVNIMASPGAGKTTCLMRTIEKLRDKYKIGVMEADIEADVDADKMEKAGVRTIQVHTGGECAMDADMTAAALREFPSDDLDLIFMENIGNLVCPAENDTGATKNVAILSIPEGDDKPLKYPLMFQVCQAVIINKIDTREFFEFDDEAVVRRIKRLNPEAEVFFVSAKTGQGIEKWTKWLECEIDSQRKN